MCRFHVEGGCVCELQFNLFQWVNLSLEALFWVPWTKYVNEPPVLSSPFLVLAGDPLRQIWLYMFYN